MRLDKLAITAQEALQGALGIAGDNDNSIVDPLHLLAALLDANENNLSAIVKRIGADPAQLRGKTYDEIGKLPKVTGSPSMPGQDLQIGRAHV